MMSKSLPDGWREVRLDSIVDFNPKRSIAKKQEAPFVAMADILENSKRIANISIREFTGGGSKFKNGDTLLFGRESSGVPKKVHKIMKYRIKIPMVEKKRSLNLASSVAIILSENIRQTNYLWTN